MNPEDKPAFAEILTGMAETHRVELTEAVFKIWWNAHQGWTIDEFRAAADHLITTCEFMPKPYDFAQLRKAQQLTPDEAWSKALAHAASGQWRYGGCGEAGVDAAVRLMGGYNVIAMGKESEQQWTQKRFREAYEDSRDAGEARQALPQIGMEKIAALIGDGSK